MPTHSLLRFLAVWTGEVLLATQCFIGPLGLHLHIITTLEFEIAPGDYDHNSQSAACFAYNLPWLRQLCHTGQLISLSKAAKWGLGGKNPQPLQSLLSSPARAWHSAIALLADI